MDKAPPLLVQTWLNTNQSITLEQCRGQVLVMYAFQMLCPGCVYYTVPQAVRLNKAISNQAVLVLGLHTVFEHHQKMTEDKLLVFLKQQQVDFPVAIDSPAKPGERLPQTMSAYAMQGTPTLVLIDKNGYLRQQKFGHQDDESLVKTINSLLQE